MTNRIIVPAVYDFDVIIRVDTSTGRSEMQVRNRSKKQLSMWQVVGLLVQHASVTLNSLLTGGKVLQMPVPDEIDEKAGDTSAS